MVSKSREVGRFVRFVWFTSSNFDECVKKHREVGRLGSYPNSNDVVSKSREVGRFVRFVWFTSSKFDECVTKTREVGRFVRFVLCISSNFDECIKKQREVRFESEFKRCRLKIKGGREVRSFVSFRSYLQILMSASKNKGR